MKIITVKAKTLKELETKLSRIKREFKVLFVGKDKGLYMALVEIRMPDNNNDKQIYGAVHD